MPKKKEQKRASGSSISRRTQRARESEREIEKNSKLIKDDLPKEENVSPVRFIEKRRGRPFHDQIDQLDMNHLHRPTGLFDLTLMLIWAALLTRKSCKSNGSIARTKKEEYRAMFGLENPLQTLRNKHTN